MSALPAIRETSDLSPTNDHAPQTIAEARLLIATASPLELKEIHDRSTTAEVFARAKQNREAYMLAGEVKLWSERRIGEIRHALPRRNRPFRTVDRAKAKQLYDKGMSIRQIAQELGVSKTGLYNAKREGWKVEQDPHPVQDFDKEFAVSRTTVLAWERMSEIPEPRFIELVEQTKAADGAMTAVGILARARRADVRRIAPGIYQVSDGRLMLQWSRDGIRRTKVLPHGDIGKARSELARVRGRLPNSRRGKVGSTAGDAWNLVVRALKVIDELDTRDAHPDKKKAIQEATRYLHKAEDELVKVANL